MLKGCLVRVLCVLMLGRNESLIDRKKQGGALQTIMERRKEGREKGWRKRMDIGEILREMEKGETVKGERGIVGGKNRQRMWRRWGNGEKEREKVGRTKDGDRKRKTRKTRQKKENERDSERVRQREREME